MNIYLIKGQIFFTLSASYGGMATLASYNKFNHNILRFLDIKILFGKVHLILNILIILNELKKRDAILIPVANCLTSFFAGFVIFSYLGYLSVITGQPVGEVVQAGQGLAYVVYPYAGFFFLISIYSIFFEIFMIQAGEPYILRLTSKHHNLRSKFSI